MRPFADISDAYLRLRHSHGFGVHSPLAYNFVKRVITPVNEIYYGYDDIEREFLDAKGEYTKRERKVAELLLRASVFLKAGSVYFHEGLPELYRTGLIASNSRMIFYSDKKDISKADMVILDSSAGGGMDFNSLPLTPERSIFIFGRGVEPGQLYKRMDTGLLLEGRRGSIVLLSGRSLDKLRYTVNL